MLNAATLRGNTAWVDEASRIELARQDPAQFGALYDSHVDRIYRYAYRRVRNQATAEDVTAEVFAKALKALPRYRQTGRPFAAWLYRIAANVLVDHERGFQRLESADLLESVSDGVSVENLVVGRDETYRLWSLVKTLTPDQKAAIRLKFLHQMSINEIAGVMDRSPGAVKLLVHRGLVRLREQAHLLRPEVAAGSCAR